MCCVVCVCVPVSPAARRAPISPAPTAVSPTTAPARVAAITARVAAVATIPTAARTGHTTRTHTHDTTSRCAMHFVVCPHTHIPISATAAAAAGVSATARADPTQTHQSPHTCVGVFARVQVLPISPTAAAVARVPAAATPIAAAREPTHLPAGTAAASVCPRAVRTAVADRYT